MSYEYLKKGSYAFNTIAGTDKENHISAFNKQLNFLQEEVNELDEALFNLDVVEAADAVVDAMVVLTGMYQKLENMGVDMDEVVKRVVDNNLSKYPSFHTTQVVQDTVDKYLQEGITITVKEDIEGHCYVFRNAKTGKILKPSTYVPVDLKDCVPEGVKFIYD